jgi:flagellar hook-associated protein 2
MSTFTFGGLASGLDTNAIIDAIVAAERVPVTQARNRQTSINSALTTVNNVSSKLSNLKSAAQALSTALGFSSYKSTSSDAAVVATVSGVASPGTFDLTVQQLAKEQRTYSDVQGSNTAALGMAGTLDLAVGSGAPVSLAIGAGDSLADVASKINGAGLRVSASVIYDGAAYKLQVRGLDSGAANSVSFVENGFSLGLSTPANTVQTARDARIVMDGNIITRPTNQFVGVVPGVTLALTKESASPVTIQVESDPTSLKTKIQAFVTAYNDVVTTAQTASGWGSQKPGNSLLAGDSALRTVLDKLSSSVGNNVPGTTGAYQTLASIGVSSNRDAKLQIDDAKLTAALSANPTAVTRLFVEDAQTGSVGAMKGVMTLVDQLATNSNSTLKTKSESLSGQAKRLDDDIASIERRVDLMATQMRQRFTQLEMIMTRYKAQGNALAGLPINSSK